MNIAQAKQIPLDRLLAWLGYQPVEHRQNGELWYRSPFTLGDETPSFHISPSRRGWKDFTGAVERGGGIIEFVQAYYHLAGNDVVGALKKIGELAGETGLFTLGAFPAPQLTPSVPRQTTPITITKIQVLAEPALIRYCNSRCITAAQARAYLKEIHYTHAGKAYFALGFRNQAGGWELRNPYYKGSTGTKDISLPLGTKRLSSAPVAVFEGFFDFLSAIALHRLPDPFTTIIVLNTAALKGKAIALMRQWDTREIHLFLDNDPAGTQLAEHFRQALPSATINDHAPDYAPHKDLNAYHQTINHRPSQHADR